MTPDELHDLCVFSAINRLKAQAGVKALAADRVGPGEPAELPGIVVTKGKRHDPPPSATPVLGQMNLWIEGRAADRTVLDLLMTAIVRALSGELLAPPDVQQCVHFDSGRTEEGEEVHSRKDAFGCFVQVNPAGPVPLAQGPYPPPARPPESTR